MRNLLRCSVGAFFVVVAVLSGCTRYADYVRDPVTKADYLCVFPDRQPSCLLRKAGGVEKTWRWEGYSGALALDATGKHLAMVSKKADLTPMITVFDAASLQPINRWQIVTPVCDPNSRSYIWHPRMAYSPTGNLLATYYWLDTYGSGRSEVVTIWDPHKGLLLQDITIPERPYRPDSSIMGDYVSSRVLDIRFSADEKYVAIYGCYAVELWPRSGPYFTKFHGALLVWCVADGSLVRLAENIYAADVKEKAIKTSLGLYGVQITPQVSWVTDGRQYQVQLPNGSRISIDDVSPDTSGGRTGAGRIQ
jgi:hypothetical protein